MYDFTTLVNHRHGNSAKWQQVYGTGATDDAIALSVADMEFATAPEIVKAIVDAAQHDVLGYEIVGDAYKAAVIGWMHDRHHADFSPDMLSVSDGVMPAIHTALRALTQPGDAVIVQQPVYYPFMHAADHNGLKLLNNELIRRADGSYAMNFDDLTVKASDPRCHAIIVSNPHNPVGRVWTPDELRRLGDICIANNVTVLCDEIHADFAYPGHAVTMFGTLGVEYAQHCIEFTAPSKTFNLAGLLCSNVFIADPGLRDRYAIAADSISGMMANHFGLVACQAAYEHAAPWLDALQSVLVTNLGVLRDFADAAPGVTLVEPEGTYLAWLDCTGLGMDAKALESFMHDRAQVFCDEGIMFGEGGAGFERINIACPTALLERALDQIAHAIRELEQR